MSAMTPTAEEILTLRFSKGQTPRMYTIEECMEFGKNIASLSWEAGVKCEYLSSTGKHDADKMKESFMKKLFEGEKEWV